MKITVNGNTLGATTKGFGRKVKNTAVAAKTKVDEAQFNLDTHAVKARFHRSSSDEG